MGPWEWGVRGWGWGEPCTGSSFFFSLFVVLAATAPQRKAPVKNTLAGHTQHTPWPPKAPPLPSPLHFAHQSNLEKSEACRGEGSGWVEGNPIQS